MVKYDWCVNCGYVVEINEFTKEGTDKVVCFPMTAIGGVSV